MAVRALLTANKWAWSHRGQRDQGQLPLANQSVSRTVQIEVDSRRTQFLGSRLPLLLGRTVSIASFAPEITMEATTALPAPAHAPIPTALTEPHTSHAPLAHIAQAAPTAQTPAPATDVTKPETEPPTAPAASSAVGDPVHDVPSEVGVADDAATRASIASEAEEKLTIEIVILWGDHKSANTAVRLTRAEAKPLRLALAEQMKSLRLELAEKLYEMKAILVGTGREGRWAGYLREQGLPVASADRLVGEHLAKLAVPEDKLLSEELPVATVDEVRKLAKKMLPKLAKVITTAELAFAFFDEIFWNLEPAAGRETDDGFEVFSESHDDDADVEDQAAELAIPVPAAAQP
jgi:hypothetical protein